MARFSNNNSQQSREIMSAPQQGMTLNTSPMGGMMSGNMMTPEVAGRMSQVLGEMWLAKNFPRDMANVYQRIDNACASSNLAQKSLYQYAKGGTSVAGPSIRLAEAVATAYGNMNYGFEVVSATDKESKLRAYAFDKETNTSAERVFTVPHRRDTKSGSYSLTDSREIYELQANFASRRVRACILEVIPINVIDYAVDACKKTLETKINVTPERVNGMLKKFEEFGVTRAHIEKFIQRSIESIQPPQFVRLIGIYESLSDKMGAPEDFFDMSVAQEPAKATTPAIEKKTAPAPQVATPAPETEPEDEAADFDLTADDDLEDVVF